MKYSELIQFSIAAIIFALLLKSSYAREEKRKYSEQSLYATINSTKKFGILWTVLLLCIFKIIFEIVIIFKH